MRAIMSLFPHDSFIIALNKTIAIVANKGHQNYILLTQEICIKYLFSYILFSVKS